MDSPENTYSRQSSSGMSLQPRRRTPLQDATNLLQANIAASSLVSKKEQEVELLLEDIFNSLPVPPNASATELAKIWKDGVRDKLAAMSVTLSHKVSPLVQIMLDQRLGCIMNQTFVKVQSDCPDLKEMSQNYRRCFETWVDDEHRVHFRAMNKDLLGKLSAKDVFILTFFSMCTCQRIKNDNLMQLGMSGCSTSGKSTLFESVLLEGAHATTNEQGVGRFQVGNKPVLLFQDILIRTLAKSKDTDKIKTIARTETTISKVHGDVITLPPLFIFYSSNERLLNHEFPPAPPNVRNKWRFYGHQVNPVGSKRVTEHCLAAIQNRFIEAFVREPPKLDKKFLPPSSGFQRLHGVLGMFPRVMSILHNHAKEDFHSPVLLQYVLGGLAGNTIIYRAVLGKDFAPFIRELIVKLVAPHLRDSLFALL